MLPTAILLAGGCPEGLDAVKVMGWGMQVQVESWFGSPELSQQGWSISAISLFADAGLLSSTWSWVIHQMIALFDSFPGCYLLWLFFFFSFMLQHFPFVSCVCAQCQWQPALQLVSPMLVTKGTQGDVPAHKCQSKGWCRARQRLGSTAKEKDPVFTEGYTETKEIYQIVIC